MNRTQSWILNGASLLLAALIGFEIQSVHQLDHVTELLHQAQTPLVQAQQQAPQIQHLLQRIALGATRDPALQEMLAKYGIVLKSTAAASTPGVREAAAATPHS